MEGLVAIAVILAELSVRTKERAVDVLFVPVWR